MTKPNRFLKHTPSQNYHMKIPKLEIANHIANRGTKALLDIERMCINARSISDDSSISTETKAMLLSRIMRDVYEKVIEGTESCYTAK